MGWGGDFGELDDVERGVFPGFAFENVAYLTGKDGFTWVRKPIVVDFTTTFKAVRG